MGFRPEMLKHFPSCSRPSVDATNLFIPTATGQLYVRKWSRGVRDWASTTTSAQLGAKSGITHRGASADLAVQDLYMWSPQWDTKSCMSTILHPGVCFIELNFPEKNNEPKYGPHTLWLAVTSQHSSGNALSASEDVNPFGGLICFNIFLPNTFSLFSSAQFLRCIASDSE